MDFNDILVFNESGGGGGGAGGALNRAIGRAERDDAVRRELRGIASRRNRPGGSDAVAGSAIRRSLRGGTLSREERRIVSNFTRQAQTTVRSRRAAAGARGTGTPRRARR